MFHFPRVKERGLDTVIIEVLSRVHKVTEGLLGDDQVGFKAGRGCAD